MSKNIRSEYIKSLVEQKESLSRDLEENTKATIKEALGEAVNKSLRDILSESNDDFEVEEVTPDTDDTENAEDATSDVTVDVEDGAEGETPDAEGSEDSTEAEDNGSSEDAEDDVWSELEQYKGEDGEYDLTGMSKEDSIKVLKVMNPDEDGIRVMQNDNGTITIKDDANETEYLIDIDGSLDGAEGDEAEDEFELELDTNESVNEGEVDLGYTDSYQKKTAMTTPDNHEPADKKSTREPEVKANAIPTGTEKPWVGNKGDMTPYNENVQECDGAECEKPVDEGATTVTQNNSNVRDVTMNHVPNSSSQKYARNGHVEGEEKRGTGEGYQPTSESITYIKQKANQIFKENKELKAIAEDIRLKLDEAVVINYNLGRVVKILTENTTTRDEKVSIVKRFNAVKTVNESKALYESITNELKSNKPSNTGITDKQLAESKKSQLVETTIYQSDDLPEMLSLMERLSKIK